MTISTHDPRGLSLAGLEGLVFRWRDRPKGWRAPVSSIGGSLTEPIAGAPATLARGGQERLASSLLALAGADGSSLVARLLCDGELEVAGHDGRYNSGPTALAILFPRHADAAADRRGSHPLAHLSRAGIDYAIALANMPEPALIRAVYRFGAEARTARMDRRLGDMRAVRRWLQLDRLVLGTTGGGRPARYRQLPRTASDPWIRWHRLDLVGGASRHKIYISPVAEELPDVLALTVRVAVQMGVAGFKVGGDASGAVRAEKLVLYCGDRDEIAAVGAELRVALKGARALGVPFTAPLGPDGLLSAGVDPAAERRAAGRPASWRLVVSDALARAARDASPLRSRAAAVDFICWRLRIEGIDPEAWTWI
jgi:hypothetical protein